MDKKTFEKALATGYIRYRAVCKTHSFEGDWHENKSGALTDAELHMQQKPRPHEITIIVEQSLKLEADE